jgi:hypothetical protein
MNYGKARIMRKVFGRVLGGNIFAAMLAAHLGKKAYSHYMGRRRARQQFYY